MFFGSLTVDLDIKDQFLETLIQVSSEADILMLKVVLSHVFVG